jgi:hypothetical protein
MHADGSGRRKLTPEPISEINSLSPGEEWVIGQGPIPDKGVGLAEFAYSTTGGSPVPLSTLPGRALFAPDGRFLFITVSGGLMDAGASGRTYVLPVRPGSPFPALPPGGFHSEAEIASVPGVRVIEAADIGPGPSPDLYTFSREIVQRNLYRIPLR